MYYTLLVVDNMYTRLCVLSAPLAEVMGKEKVGVVSHILLMQVH